jgi:V/A-type H+/Na+-transporting ATPase subunit I
MSLVPLRHVTLIGMLADKPAIIAKLQQLGFLQLQARRPEDVLPREVAGGPSPEAREALAFLLDSPWQRRRRRSPGREGFDPLQIQRRALELQQRLRELRDQRDFLKVRIRNLEPWGAFEFGSLEEMAGQRLWFYQIPHYQLAKIPDDLPHTIVHHDHRFAYVVVVTPEEPTTMPLPRVHTGAISRAKLIDRLEEIEAEIEDLQGERAVLTRWIDLFAASLDRLEDDAARHKAATLAHNDAPLFALSAWAPVGRVDELREALAEHELIVEVREPGPGDEPPTLFTSSERLAGAQSLVTFYMTPGYFTWDPSVAVLIGFAIMFAMIVADAGYGLLLGLISLLFWGRMATGMRVVVGSVVGATIVYGVLVGSYFGVIPGPLGPLGRVRMVDAADPSTMMALSIVLGVVHLTVANLADAWRLRSAASLAPLGWVVILLGGLVAIGSVTEVIPSFTNVGLIAIGVGALAVLLFSATGVSFGTRLLRGLLALTGLTNAFGDVLSYLRLFALGLASGSLAAAFNDLAMQAHGAIEGAGVAIALVILLVGHGLNFLLALMSGVVHGLRLNYIEFFNWGLKAEGKPFRAFRRKERIEPWNQSS